MRKKIKRIMIYCFLMVLLPSIIFISCGVRKILQLNAAKEEQVENLPETFREETPLHLKEGWFFIQAKINRQHYKNFIIDTKASSILIQDEIEDWNANYWGTFPFVKSTNAYGQKQKILIYHFNTLEIGSLIVEKPLFEKMPNDNAIYELLSANDAGILGHTLLPQLCWKFSIDEQRLIMFNKNDSALIAKETAGFIRMKGGIGPRDNMSLSFSPLQHSDKFILDLGYTGEVEVNKKTFAALSEHYPVKEILMARSGTIDEIIYMIENADIRWDDFLIPDCQVVYMPLVNMNLIGGGLMQRFNFVLAYKQQEPPKSGFRLHTPPSKDILYLKPVSNFDSIQSTPYTSSLGFKLGKLNGKLIISAIEIGSPVELAGLQIRDEIISLDNGDYNINFDNHIHEDFIEYIADKESVVVRVKRDENIIEVLINI